MLCENILAVVVPLFLTTYVTCFPVRRSCTIFEIAIILINTIIIIYYCTKISSYRHQPPLLLSYYYYTITTAKPNNTPIAAPAEAYDCVGKMRSRRRGTATCNASVDA